MELTLDIASDNLVVFRDPHELSTGETLDSLSGTAYLYSPGDDPDAAAPVASATLNWVEDNGRYEAVFTAASLLLVEGERYPGKVVFSGAASATRYPHFTAVRRGAC